MLKYILITKNKEIEGMLRTMLEDALLICDDLNSCIRMLDNPEISGGAVIFAHSSVYSPISGYAVKLYTLLDKAKDRRLKTICMIADYSESISMDMLGRIYDVISLKDPAWLIKKKLTNISHLVAMEILVEETLDFSAISSGDKTSQERFNLYKMLSYIGSVTYEQCMNKGLTYELYMKNDVPEFLIGDRVKLNQIFLNLMTSAVKFTDHGGRVSFSAEQIGRIGDKVRLKFIVKGTGLALGDISRMLNLKNASVSVEADKDNNTVVTVLFDAMCDVSADIDENEAKIKYKDLKVALISDAHKVSKHTAQTFERLGLTTERFFSLYDLRKNIEAGGQFNICVIDGEMQQDENLVKELRLMPGLFSSLIIVITYNTDRNRVEYLRAGANAVMGKPISKIGIYNTLNQLLSHKVNYNQETASKGTSLSGKSILVVEDNELSLEVATTVLRAAGVNVDEARNGIEAVSKYNMSSTGQYDLILMDLRMPGMSGSEAAVEIRKSTRTDANLPIIALTSVYKKEEQNEAMESGMNDILMKPLNVKELSEVLEKITK